MAVSVAASLAVVRQRIEAACVRCGRDPGEVRLIPVSKTRPVADIMAARDAGVTRFGENRAQELAAKALEIGSSGGVEFAMIGRLQTNKAGLVAEHAVEFQALDSLRLAAALDRRAAKLGRRLDVMVQVNTSAEATKAGVDPEEAVELAKGLSAFDALRVTGLMTIAHPGPERARIEACFVSLARLRDRLRDEGAAGSTWDELSMGMSGDFELAIEHGATVVRVGTAIFGARPV